MSAERTERHQEGERKTDPCGCQFIWCRGQWWPSGLTCSTHWDGDDEASDLEDPDDDGPDLGSCPYFAHYYNPEENPMGTCTFGCWEEPECVTCQPEGGWAGYPRDPETGFPLPRQAAG